MAALAVATEYRLRRAEERRRLAALPLPEGLRGVAALVEDLPDWLGSARPAEPLRWPRRSGPHRVQLILTRARLGVTTRTLGELTQRERDVLAQVIRSAAEELDA
jgi:hypothetical protein